ncbi:XRE family transcriptional regulator [Ensifer sp. MJa1]|uniref:XRE family transcriptional regulator n=1 Tax=Ensifer sp. MJa1 TaxID=2919888 RepID=UPI00300A5C0A
MSHRDPPIGEALQKLVSEIRHSGMPPSEIVRETGLSRNTLWRMESGLATAPSYGTVQRLQNLRDRLKR